MTAAQQREIPWRPLQRGAAIAGALGLAVWAIGWALAVQQGDTNLHMKVFFSYLFAFAFCLSIPLGSMAIWMIHNQTGGHWGYAIRRAIEAGTRTVPFMAILFVPLVFGLRHVYLWADLTQVHEEELLRVLRHKALYLNVSGFLIRAAIFFALWSFIAIGLSRLALAAERRPEPAVGRRLQVFSGPAFLVYALGMTFASIDWLMSLEPDWYSTIYAMLVVAGQLVPALGFAVAATAWLASYRSHEERNPEVWNDLGNLMLATVMFWAYLSVSQLLLIWSGNLTEEIPWYLRRSQGGWQCIAWVLATCYFCLPFLALMSRRLKRDPRGLMTIGAGLLVVSAVHYFWLVNPVYAARAAGDYAAYGPLSLHWLDVAALVGIGGTTLAIFLWQLRARPVTPPPIPFPAEQEAASHA
jgi:hypothetical protein